MFESLFFLARDRAGALQAALGGAASGPPTARATLDGVRVSLWRVGGPAAVQLAAAAGTVLYIADGHHRFETAVAFRRELPSADRTVGLIVPLGDPGLVVLPTHRLVYGAPLAEGAVISALGGEFAVERVEPELDPDALLREAGRGTTAALVSLPGGVVLSLRLKAGAQPPAPGEGPAASLDVARVDALVVARLQQLAGPGARVGYTAQTGELFNEVGGGGAAAGVMLNPTRVEDVLAVADARQVMPQKSTYFIPKVPSGLVLLPLD
jgi:uncharacterized protein (DUF1015 family)